MANSSAPTVTDPRAALVEFDAVEFEGLAAVAEPRARPPRHPPGTNYAFMGDLALQECRQKVRALDLG